MCVCVAVLFLFGIRRNLRSGRSRSLYLSIRRAIKQIVVVIGACHPCQLRTKFYPMVPNILHSDKGREFCNQIIKSLCEMWNDIKIVHGKLRHNESQGSVERANQDVENMLAT
jgi:transposase InsO family protein